MRTGIYPGLVVFSSTDINTATSAKTGVQMHKSQEVGRIANMSLSQGTSPTA